MKLPQLGDPILRATAKKVDMGELLAGEYRPLIKRMVATMTRLKGVGLAAPQLGESLAMAVICIQPSVIRPNVVPFPLTVIVNPEILSSSDHMEEDFEGCLSFPGADGYIRASVPRHDSIRVQYWDEAGQKHDEEHTGVVARVFQHEIDHLHGIIFVDRIADTRTFMTHREFMERNIGNPPKK